MGHQDAVISVEHNVTGYGETTQAVSHLRVMGVEQSREGRKVGCGTGRGEASINGQSHVFVVNDGAQVGFPVTRAARMESATT
jgi:hypothetical protein